MDKVTRIEEDHNKSTRYLRCPILEDPGPVSENEGGKRVEIQLLPD